VAGLIFADSFDHHNGYQIDARKGWGTATGRDSGRGVAGYSITSGDLLFPETAIIAVGMAFRTVAWGNNSIKICDGLGRRLVSIDLWSDGRLGVSSGMGGFGQGPSGYVGHLNQWAYHELRAFIYLISPDPPRYAIDFHAYVNEKSELSGTLSSLVVPSPFFRQLTLVGAGGGVLHRRDDIYITDGEVLGDVRIEPLHPGSDGYYAGWTPNGGSAHYDRVDEALVDDETTYLEAAAIGAAESHALAAHDTGETKGIYVWLGLRNTLGEASKTTSLLRISGADYLGDEKAPASTYKFYGEGRLTNPATGLAWTDGDLDALELGVVNSA